MARGKVQMKRIENPVHRQVTFCKRRTGLLKKAKELSVLCDAHVGLFIFSSHGKLYELATTGNMQGLIERYKSYTRASDHPLPDQDIELQSAMEPKEEINMLKQEIEILQKGLSYMFGGGSESMTLNELLMLEKHLEIWIYQVRSAKMDHMFQQIQLLRNKEMMLNAANKQLQEKLEENNIPSVDIESLTANFLPYDLLTPETVQYQYY